MKSIIFKVLNSISYLFFSYVLFTVFRYDLDNVQDIVKFELRYLIISILCILASNIIVGLTWSTYVFDNYKVSFRISFTEWLNAYKAKYIPGKITSPILRIQHDSFKELRSNLYFSIFIEQIYLISSNLILGSFLLLKNYYSFQSHIFIYVFFNLILFLLRKINFRSFNLKYFKYIFIIQFSALLNYLGLYFASKILVNIYILEVTLLYQLVQSLSLIVSITPAGLGIREFGVLKMSKLFKINLLSLEYVVIAFRILYIFVDLLIVITSYCINTFYTKK